MSIYSEETRLLTYINRLPYELVDIIHSYIPIHVAKKFRKIKKEELPTNYLICKELSDHFYKKYIGYELDINYKKRRIELLQNRNIANKSKYFNPYCFDAWKALYYNSVTVRNEICETESQINGCNILYEYYIQYYKASTRHLYNFKLFIV